MPHNSHAPAARYPRSYVIAAFAAVYIVWGSTYLAIRFSVETIPPFLHAALRFLISGAVLFAWRRMAGDPAPTLNNWKSTAIVGAALDSFGQIDAVINNAGIYDPAPFGEATLEQYRALLDVHFFGALHVTRAAWPHFVRAGYGRVVNTVSEAMLLVSFVKQPEADPSDPEGLPGYDPTRNAKAKENAIGRWTYVRAGMVKLGYLTQAQADALQFPPDGDVKKYDPKAYASQMDTPAGLVVLHALSELRQTPQFQGKPEGYIENGGYKIVTTVNNDKLLQLADSPGHASAGTALPLFSPGSSSTQSFRAVSVNSLNGATFSRSPSCVTVSNRGSGFQMPGVFAFCGSDLQSIWLSSQSGWPPLKT